LGHADRHRGQSRSCHHRHQYQGRSRSPLRIERASPDGWRRRSSLGRLSPDLARRLVFAQADENCVARQAVVRPTEIGDFGDQFGSEPRAIGCETIYAFIYRTGQKAEALWRYLTRRHKHRRPVMPPSLACRAWKGCANPLLLTPLRFAPESRRSYSEAILRLASEAKA
jgi:hypothetical protein